MIEGGCFCGQVRFHIEDGDYTVADCHCSMCRRIHAAPYVSWLVVPIDKFNYRNGSPSEIQSSETGKRYFCATCGTQLACSNSKHPEIIDIPTGCLDNPEDFNPTIAVFEDTRLPWVAHKQES